jgi:hypothetical protein
MSKLDSLKLITEMNLNGSIVNVPESKIIVNNAGKAKQTFCIEL